nr:GNAT family N-acetyltransferase [uncultured Pedobacter sp.]
MTDNFIIRKGQLNDLIELQKLYVDTITEICKADYDNEQIDAWTSDTKNNPNKQRWQDILTNQFVLVAQKDNKIVGFATLDKGNYIDLFYVHKDYQRQGIANKLCADVVTEAKREQQRVLTSDVSKTARPFFEKNGFKVLKEQIVNKKGIKLVNYKMTKTIDV